MDNNWLLYDNNGKYDGGQYYKIMESISPGFSAIMEKSMNPIVISDKKEGAGNDKIEKVDNTRATHEDNVMICKQTYIKKDGTIAEYRQVRRRKTENKKSPIDEDAILSCMDQYMNPTAIAKKLSISIYHVKKVVNKYKGKSISGAIGIGRFIE